MKPKANFLKINNKLIEYIKKGEGRDLLFIHGGTVSYRSHLEFIERLSENFTVWALSLPGAGRSSKIPRNWKLKNYSEIIKKIITEKGINPIIAGHSLGGAIAVKTVIDYPDLCEKVVLFAPSLLRQKKANKSIWNVIKNHLEKLSGRKSNAKTDLLLNLRKHFIDMLRISKVFKKVDFKEDLKDIKSKVLIFGGKDDEIIEPSNWKEIDNLIKDSKLLLLPTKHNLLSTHAGVIRDEIVKYYE